MLKNKNNIIFQTFIGPWVLPNEEIPLYIIWNEDFDFDSIKISKPTDIKLVEMINIEKYNEEENCFIILKEKIKKHNNNKDFPSFFGVIFIYNNPNFEGLKLFKEIRISFLKDSELIKKFDFLAKIFRPILNNLSEIHPIELKDKTDNYEVSLNLECKGFGFVSTSIEVEINKIKIKFDDTVFERVYKSLEQKYMKFLNNNLEDFEPMIKKEIEGNINEESVRKFLRIIKNNILTENKDSPELIDLFEKENVETILILDFIMEVIKEIKIRYKNENVLLKTPILELPKESFDEFVNKIKLLIHYEDLKGNQYNPLILEMKVNDHRSQPQRTKINFVIKIDRIEDKTFKNIEQVM